jgi:hypothetical protein
VPSNQQVRRLANAAALDEWDRLDDNGDTTSKPRVDRAEVVGFDQVRITISADPILIVPRLFGGDPLTITESAGGPFEIFKRSGDG